MYANYPPEASDIFDAIRSIRQANEALLHLHRLIHATRSRHRDEMMRMAMVTLSAQQAALHEAGRAGLRLCRRPAAPVLRLVPKEAAQL